ncbi:MAG: DUF5702 domain-containing protein [Clostridia bacterium]|nr:DUF5702 domain-containing protein [Clostridia bacterium]
MQFFNKSKGSISIFLVLILMPLLTSSYIAIEAVRVSTVQANIYGKLNLTGNAACNSFCDILREYYGLYAMPAYDNSFANEMESVFSYGLSTEDDEKSLFISPTIKKFTLSFPSSSALPMTASFENAVTEYMKYRAPIKASTELAEKTGALREIEIISKTIKASQGYYDSLYKVDRELRKIALKLPDTDDIEDTVKTIKTLIEATDTIGKLAKKSYDEAETWKKSIDSIKSGDVKTAFMGNYTSSAGCLSKEHIEEFRNTLEQDLKTAGEGGTELNYKNDPLYLYIASSKDVSSEPDFSMDFDNDLLSAVSGKATDVMEACFLEEFCTSMFSMQTTKAGEKSLAGLEFDTMPNFGSEVEYILFGKEDMQQNVEMASSLIYSIRLILDSLYAFSNTKMRTEALTAASAVAGWTGAGVTAVQAGILMAWAAAEAMVDIATLKKGGAVPLYKSASTWTVSLSGVTEILANGAGELAAKEVDNVQKLITDVADGAVESCANAADKYVENCMAGAAEHITSMIMTPVETTISSALNNRFSSAGLSQEDIKNQIIDAINKATEGQSGKGIDIAKGLFINNCLDQLVATVYANYGYLVSDDEELSKLAFGAIQNAIDSAFEKLYSMVSREIDEKASLVESKIDGAVSNGGEKAKKLITEEINRYSDYLKTYLGNGEGKSTAITSTSGLAMTYSDYLRVFAIAKLGTQTGKDAMVTRMADIIQENCKTKEAAFDISQCYREISLSAEVKVAGRSLKRCENYYY